VDKHRINLYEIENLADHKFDYQLVQVIGFDRSSASNPDLIDRGLNTLSKLVAIREKCPVAIVREGSATSLAVPAFVRLTEDEYHLAPDVVRLKADGRVRACHLGTENPRDRHVCTSFLNFDLRGQLRRESELWSGNAHAFFPRKPLNGGNLSREIDFYEGFHFHLRYFENRLFVGIKLAHKYVDAAWAVDRFREQSFEKLKMRMLLYHFGYSWYPIQLIEVLDKSIAETEFVLQGSEKSVNLYDYVVEKAGKNAPQWIRGLDPKSPAVRYRNPGRDQRLFAPLALLKLIHRTEDAGAKELHRQSIKEPEDRFSFGRLVVEKYFQTQRFLGQPLSINPASHVVRPSVFPVPSLEFGQGKLLRVAEHPRAGEVRLADLGRSMISFLTDATAGVAVTSPLEPQYILIPRSLDRTVGSEITKRLEAATRSFLQSPYRLDTVLYDDRSSRTLKHYVDAILAGVRQSNVKHGRGVLVLPAKAPDDLHNYIKRALREQLQFQCLKADRLESFFHTVIRDGARSIEAIPGLNRRLSSYINFAALGLLIVNRQWAWTLHEGTRYEAYVNFDVLNGHAAFTFFYEGGRHCYTRTLDSGQSEKLLRSQVRSVIYEGLKSDLKAVRMLKSLILQRDGRLFNAEWLGFEDAVKQLISEKMLPVDILWGGIEIAKKFSSGLRLVREVAGGLQNPVIGTSLRVSSDEGIVCTTGYPFSIPGTASPLAVRVVHGDLNLEWVMEDIFRKSLLAWPSPGNCLSVPIDLKLCDEVLRAFASEADDEGALHGLEVEDSTEVA
jgi:hypothetical protein